MFRIPKSAAERQRERRQYIRTDPDLWKAHLEKDARRKCVMYQNASVTELCHLRKISKKSSEKYRSKGTTATADAQDCSPMAEYGNAHPFIRQRIG